MGCQRRVIPGKVDPSVWRSEENVSKGSVWHIKDVLDIITHIAHRRCNAPKSYAELALHCRNPSISVTNNSSSATASIIAETPHGTGHWCWFSWGWRKTTGSSKDVSYCIQRLYSHLSRWKITTYRLSFHSAWYAHTSVELLDMKWRDGAFFDTLHWSCHWNNRRKDRILLTMPD